MSEIIDNMSEFDYEEKTEEKPADSTDLQDAIENVENVPYPTDVAEEPGAEYAPSQVPPDLYKLPNKIKENFIPPLGVVLTFGPMVFRVTYRNVGKLRFSAELIGMQEESQITGPDGKPQVKTTPLPITKE